MKFGALNSAIRSMKGSPKVGGVYHPEGRDDVELTELEVTKQSMLAALKRAFPDATKGTETGLRLKADGHIGVEGDGADQDDVLGGDSEATEDDDILG